MCLQIVSAFFLPFLIVTAEIGTIFMRKMNFFRVFLEKMHGQFEKIIVY